MESKTVKILKRVHDNLEIYKMRYLNGTIEYR